MNSVWIQRWIGKPHSDFVENFFIPLFKQTGTKLIYEIDDLTDANFIPLYNHGRKGFESQEVQDSIKKMLELSDNVVVTTNKLRDMMSSGYGISKDKIVAIPNLLPHWWIGDRYDPERKARQFSQFKPKPRIGIISSMSHYNFSGAKDSNGQIVKDDMDVIVDIIKETVDDFQWVVIGWAVHPGLSEFVKQKKIEVYPTCPLLSYPSLINRLCLQAVVAPLQDNEFNHCKSFIKYEECAALGIVLYASRMLPYSEVMPGEQMFTDANELKDKLMKLKFGSVGAYAKRIEAQWKWLNSPTKEGDADLKNWWMEDNLNIWTPLHTIVNENTLNVGVKNDNKEDRQVGTGTGSVGMEVDAQAQREVGANAS